MQQQDSRQQDVSLPPNEPSTDRIRHMHDVLSDPYRCAVLYYLQEFDEPADVREIGTQVLAWCQTDRQGGDDEEVAERAREWLLRNHVLSMDEFGLISYDPERDTVSLSDDVCMSITPSWEK